MVGEWRWRALGEMNCGCCGARYQVMTARGDARRYHYARCEVCDSVMAEWIDSWERRHLRISEPTHAPEQQRPAAVASATAL